MMKDLANNQQNAVQQWQKECAAGREAAESMVADLRRSGNVPQFTRDLIAAMEKDTGFKTGFASILAKSIPRSTDT